MPQKQPTTHKHPRRIAAEEQLKTRAGQAALEYLITYGWGFLVILVVVGSLAYYGLLTPSQYFPERCEFGPQLVCEDFYIQEAPAQVKVTLRNNFGKAINITNAYALEVCSDNVLSGGTYVTIPPGKKGEVILDIENLCSTFNHRYTKGDKDLASVTLTFQRNKTGAPRHNLTGEIFAKVH
ncbi:hypothetical protein D6783_03595 [Candidatus Woesearchaeota archaeon]|nr:MAG: hypothetical protein D6783_03595 [Candidatus Woesearchaeota archaeon]